MEMRKAGLIRDHPKIIRRIALSDKVENYKSMDKVVSSLSCLFVSLKINGYYFIFSDKQKNNTFMNTNNYHEKCYVYQYWWHTNIIDSDIQNNLALQRFTRDMVFLKVHLHIFTIFYFYFDDICSPKYFIYLFMFQKKLVFLFKCSVLNKANIGTIL